MTPTDPAPDATKECPACGSREPNHDQFHSTPPAAGEAKLVEPVLGRPQYGMATPFPKAWHEQVTQETSTATEYVTNECVEPTPAKVEAAKGEPVAVEAIRKALEDRLIEWRDARLSMLGEPSGLVVNEANGEPSNRIRMGLYEVVRFVLDRAPATASPGGEVGALREALAECIETLKSGVEPLPIEDREHADLVRAIGERIGYGALMVSASAAWRRMLTEKHGLEGAEFSAGACVSTVQAALVKARAALKREGGA